MASAVDICNMALSTVGSATTVTSIDPPDGTAAANYCAAFYDIARREAMGLSTWSWCKRRANLTELSSNPSDIWGYAYAYPAGILRPVRVLNLAVAATLYTLQSGAAAWSRASEANGADFVVERDDTQFILLTDEPDAVLIYLQDSTDTGIWSPQFVSGVSTLLASYLAGPILRGKTGAQTKAILREEALGSNGKGGVLGQAAAIDGNSTNSELASHISDSILSRA